MYKLLFSEGKVWKSETFLTIEELGNFIAKMAGDPAWINIVRCCEGDEAPVCKIQPSLNGSGGSSGKLR